MDLLHDCVRYVVQYFTFVTNIEILPGLKVGSLMLSVASFIIVVRLIIMPMFQVSNFGGGGSSSGKQGKGGK